MQVRNEINTRISFAKKQGEYWFSRMKAIQSNGNVLSSKPTRKFLQAHRIYHYYVDRFTDYLKENETNKRSPKSLGQNEG
jgi:hypothetical protein